MNADISILETVTLTHGKHAAGGSVCAMEALACAMGLPHSDTPPCTDAPLAAVVQRVNDWDGWESDEARTVYLRPYLMRLGRLAIAGNRASAAAYGYAADAADAAAANAAAYADAQAVYRESAGALLDRMLDVCEAGAWPLPVDFVRTV